MYLGIVTPGLEFSHTSTPQATFSTRVIMPAGNTSLHWRTIQYSGTSVPYSVTSVMNPAMPCGQAVYVGKGSSATLTLPIPCSPLRQLFIGPLSAVAPASSPIRIRVSAAFAFQVDVREIPSASGALNCTNGTSVAAGSGLVGGTVNLTYQAPRADPYTICVSSTDGRAGSYTITIDP